MRPLFILLLDPDFDLNPPWIEDKSTSSLAKKLFYLNYDDTYYCLRICLFKTWNFYLLLY